MYKILYGRVRDGHYYAITEKGTAMSVGGGVLLESLQSLTPKTGKLASLKPSDIREWHLVNTYNFKPLAKVTLEELQSLHQYYPELFI